MAAETLSAPELWTKTVTLVKNRVNHRSLWETMEKAAGIAIEDDTLIIGLNARISNMAGHLSVSDHRNAIERALQELTGRRLNFRIIEGDTPEDWAFTKKRDERVAAMRSSTYERKDREETEAQSWDELHDLVARAYSSTQLRQLPQRKARYLSEMFSVIIDAMDRLYPEYPDDTTERHLARVIDKVAGNAEVPSALVAFEINRIRSTRERPAG